MKILAISDLHSHLSFFPILSNLLSREKFDLCLIPGDIVIRNSDYWNYLTALEEIFSKFSLPWYCVHGNNESIDIINYLKDTKHDLHYAPQHFQKYRLVGIGWGDDLPPYELNLNQNTILLTHQPPRIQNSQFLFHNIKLTSAPLLHLAGHIHSWARVIDIGPTRYINIPAALNHFAATITLPSRQVRFIKAKQNNKF